MTAAPRLAKVLKITVEVARGPSQGEKHVFEKELIKIGRGPENDLVFSQDVKVSRHHIEVLVTSSQVTVRNLSAKNLLAVDGEIVNEKSLRPGSSIRIGETELKVTWEKPAAESKPALSMVPASPSPAPSGRAPVALNDMVRQPPMGTATAIRPTGQAYPVSPGAYPPAGRAGPPGAPAGQPPVAPWPSGPVPGSAAGSGAPPGVYDFPTPASPAGQGSSKTMIIVIAAVVLGAAYFMNEQQVKKKSEVKLRDSVTTELNITQATSEFKKTLEDIEKKGKDTIQYRLAQEQYLRGFRDYRQGQYMRAMEGFQAALSFFPNHELARKYYTLAKRKFDEQIQFNMIQGKRYYGVNNFRLCMGFYSNVIKMKKDERDPIRREALQYYRECELKLQGKY